jgi:hypothetical protein
MMLPSAGVPDSYYYYQASSIICTGVFRYVRYSFLLISNKFRNGGSGPTRAIKFLYAPAPPPPHRIGPETSLVGSWT